MVKQVKQKKRKYPEFDLGTMLPDGLVHVKQLAAKFISKRKRHAATSSNQRQPPDPKRFYRPVPMVK